MEQMKTFTVGADTWEIVDGAARDEIADARTGADGTEYESVGAAIRGAVNGINGEIDGMKEDIEADYALQDGYYEMLTAGSADNLTGRGDGVGAEFVYRTSGGNADVADGVAKIESVKGNTLVFNQLAYDPNMEITGGNTAWRSYIAENTTAVIANNSVTVTMLSDGAGYRYGIINNANTVRGVTGHVYLAMVAITSTVAARFAVDALNSGSEMLGNVAANAKTNLAAIFTNTVQSPTMALVFCPFDTIPSGGVYTVSTPQLFDLTRMFGAGNEPATVAEFEALFPETYYPYDAGSLLNVNMEGVRTVGFNLWDEEWELGGINSNTGVDIARNNLIRSKNFIPVLPETDYYFHCESMPHSSNPSLRFYDAEKNYIGYSAYGQSSVSPYDAVFKTPTNAHYMRFCHQPKYGTTYKNDTCINISWSGYRNGEYEPYWTQTREIDTAAYFPDGMKSAGSVYDELTAHKAIKRVGVVDLGTLNWVATTLNGTQAFYVTGFNDMKNVVDNGNVANICSSEFMAVSANNLFTSVNGTEIISVNTSMAIQVRDTRYNSAESLKTAMDGVMLYYELAEPVETEISPELNLTYKVSDFGTEEIIVADGKRTAPVPMQIVYGLNAVDAIRRLPVNYISHDSFMQFISAIESHFNVKITETYDSDNERYNYSIAANATNESGE